MPGWLRGSVEMASRQGEMWVCSQRQAGHSCTAGVCPRGFVEGRAVGRAVSASSTLRAQKAEVFSSDGNRTWLSPAWGRGPEKRSGLPSFLPFFV